MSNAAKIVNVSISNRWDAVIASLGLGGDDAGCGFDRIMVTGTANDIRKAAKAILEAGGPGSRQTANRLEKNAAASEFVPPWCNG